MKPFCLEVRGDYACFTRPEMKVERVSYDVITPSAARAVFESILWKPGLRWRVRRIDVLAAVRWINVRRNEVSDVVPVNTVQSAIQRGRGRLALYADEKRQQRAGLFLRDVGYRLYADLQMVGDDARSNPGKYLAMFSRRAAAGQCVNQPYLGCREFAARFRLVDVIDDDDGGWTVGSAEPQAVEQYSADLGWMLYDLDYEDFGGLQPRFFRAKVNRGVIDLASVEVTG
jgi:CRISPR-associated protein Cas5d